VLRDVTTNKSTGWEQTSYSDEWENTVSSVNVRGIISHVSYINKNTWSEEQLTLVKVNDFNNILTTA
jgi:hypothetical protein